MPSQRIRLVWLGAGPSATAIHACISRGLQIITGPTAAAQLKFAKGLIVDITDNAGSLRSYYSLLDQSVTHGVAAYVLCGLNDINQLAPELKARGLDTLVPLFLRGAATTAIENIARTLSQPVENDGLALSGGNDLTEEEEILLRRAFADCNSITLRREIGGSAKVYCGFARLTASRAGPFPFPFFVKFGRSLDIRRELRNYHECTTLHVPFGQRPNIDPGRCLIGRNRGLIVGNFIERSEPLQKVVDRGGGSGSLHSLFDSALHGWRRQSFYDAAYVRTGCIADYVQLLLPARYSRRRQKLLSQRYKAAHKADANVLGFEALQRIVEAVPSCEMRVGLTHGDLHGENIRVASGEAILIDFASVEEGPLSVDPAALDVSLVINSEKLGDDWVPFAERAFSFDALREPLAPLPPEHPAASLLDAVHFVRRQGLSSVLSAHEYPVVVALQLLRKASVSGDSVEDPRRVTAYRLASQILTQVATESGSAKRSTS